MLKKIIFFTFIIVLLSGSQFVECQAKIVDRIVAIVNGQVITLYELEKRAAPFLKKYISEDMSPDEKRQIKQQIYAKILPQMIDDYLVDEEIKKLGINVSDEELEHAIENICKSNGITREEFIEKLKKEGLTLEKYKEQMAKQIQRMQLVNAQVRSKIVITDEQVKEYIRKKNAPATYEGPFYILEHICIIPKSNSRQDIEEAKSKAKEALRELKSGASFVEVAKKFSSNTPFAKELRLGVFSLDEMAPEIRDVVRKLSPGEFSDIVKTSVGFQIFKLAGISNMKEEEIDPAQMEEVRKQLYDEAINERFQEWLNDLRAKSTIRILL